MSDGVSVTVDMTAVIADVPVTFDVMSLNCLSVFAVATLFPDFSIVARSSALVLLLMAVTDVIVAGLGFFAAVGSLIVGLDVVSVGFLFSFGFRFVPFRNSRRKSSNRIQCGGHNGMRCSLKYCSM